MLQPVTSKNRGCTERYKGRSASRLAHLVISLCNRVAGIEAANGNWQQQCRVRGVRALALHYAIIPVDELVLQKGGSPAYRLHSRPLNGRIHGGVHSKDMRMDADCGPRYLARRNEVHAIVSGNRCAACK